jgi:hypothetical protein
LQTIHEPTHSPYSPPEVGVDDLPAFIPIEEEEEEEEEVSESEIKNLRVG